MIVFDSSTLILLAKSELLETFLAESKLRAVIPSEVAREVGEERQSADALAVRRLIVGKRIVVEPLKERVLFDELQRELGLGTGEAEAIALAGAQGAQLVATDDKKAIDACKLVRIPFTTAPAVLVRMYEKGIVGQQEAVLKLSVLEREGRYKKSMIAAVLARLEMK